MLPPEDDPAWDPFHAQQDIEVGMFYLHKGDVDAAIARFEDAIRLRANFAKPRLLLAEAYEKKGDNTQAREVLQGISAGIAQRARREKSAGENRQALEKVIQRRAAIAAAQINV